MQQQRRREDEPGFDQAFRVLCLVGYLALVENVDYGVIKGIFWHAIASIPPEELLAMPEFQQAMDDVRAAGLEPRLFDNDIDLSAGMEPIEPEVN